MSARRAAQALDAFPGSPPTSLTHAYRIQDAAIDLHGRPVAGWKVGRIFPPLSVDFGADRLAGPIFADTIFFDEPGKPVSMSIFERGFGAAEAEYLLRVGQAPDPAQTRFTLDEAADLIDAVHVGIEIASSPLGTINDLGPAVTISDFGNNNGLVIGAPVADWRTSGFAAWPVRLRVDGVEAGQASADAMPDGPIGAARFLFGLLAARGIAVAPGQWISSGAITGVHRVAPGARVEAFFGDDHRLECLISAATGE